MTTKLKPQGVFSIDSSIRVLANGSVVNYDSVTPITFTDSFVGSDNPRYQSVIKAGGNATNSYTRIEKKPGFVSLRASGSRKSTAPPSVDQFQTTYQKNYYTSQLAILNAYDKTSGKLLGKIQGHRQSLRSGVVLGELRETLQLLRNPVKGLFNAVTSYTRSADAIVKQVNKAYRDNRLYGKAIPRHYRKSDKGRVKALSDLWLEAQFGWKPLLSDINGAIDAYSKASDTPRRVKLTASSEESSSLSSSPAGLTSSLLSVSWVGTQRIRTESRGRGAVWLSEVGSRLPGQQLTRLGLDPFSDFIPTVYELIPFSFVVDYFSTLGACIQQSMVSVQGVSAVYIGVETKTTTSVNCKLVSSNNPNMTVTSDFQSQDAVTSHYARYPLQARDLRAQNLTLQIPSLRQGFNLTALFSSKVSK